MLQRAYRKYRRDGLYNTIVTGKQFVRNKTIQRIVEPTTSDRIEQQVLDSERLKSYAREQGELVITDLWEQSDLSSYEDFLPESPSEMTHSRPEPWPFHDPFVCQISDSLLIGHGPFGITSEGNVILDTIIQGQEQHYRLHKSVQDLIKQCGIVFTYKYLFRTLNQQPSSELQISHGCLLTSGWNNFGHYMGEHLLKLRALEKYEERTGKFPTLILDPDPSDFVWDSLDILGVDRGDCVTYDGCVATVDTLVVPNYPHPTPGGIRWLKERFLGDTDRFVSPEFEPSNRVFISRKKADKKRILNEVEVVDMLKEYGFRSYVLEDLHLAEQAKLFSNADVVVGPTGSGFLNIMFADDISIIELVPKKDMTNWYIISNMLGFDHELSYFCDEADENMDFRVDTRGLQDTVEEILD